MATMQIPIAKAGKGVMYAVDVDELNACFEANPEVYRDIIERGLKDLLNSRMSKDIQAPSKLSGQEAEDNKAKALAKAKENFDDMKSGKLVKKTKAATAEKREVISEARRLAKEVVKNAIREDGGKPSHYAMKDITAWADKLIAADDSYIAQAKLNLEELAKVKAKIELGIKADPKLIAKAEKAKAERKTQLSAKQAGLPKASGKVPPRKGQAPSQQYTSH